MVIQSHVSLDHHINHKHHIAQEIPDWSLPQRIWQAYRAVSGASENTKTRDKIKLWMRLLMLAVLRTTGRAGMALDVCCYPAIQRIKINRPIVIVGSPRTGSTFLHRFLTDAGIGVGLSLGQMLFPSYLLQKVCKPAWPLMNKLSPAGQRSQHIHETGLTSIETDDAALFFRFFDGFFLYAFYLAFAREEHRDFFDPRKRDICQQDFRWLEQLWKRNLYSEKHSQIIAKSFSLLPRLPAFLNLFPDAKILYLIRDPADQIPSALSLITDALEQDLNFNDWPKAIRQQYYARLYDALVTLLKRFHEDWTTGRIPVENVMFVHFNQLKNEFGSLMPAVLSFLDKPMSTSLERTITTQAKAQQTYRSRHRYTPEQFGLSRTQIHHDCQFYYDTFIKKAAGTPDSTLDMP